jgi:hypothetical protein
MTLSDFQAAHRTAQDIESADGAWIHAYLLTGTT